MRATTPDTAQHWIELIRQVSATFWPTSTPFPLHSGGIFADFWPEFADFHFLANFYPISLPYDGIFADFWPKFAAIVRVRRKRTTAAAAGNGMNIYGLFSVGFVGLILR
jgi:hypothetical protein